MKRSIFMALLLGQPSALQAQYQWYREHESPLMNRQLDDVRLREAVDRFADCSVKRNTALAERYILVDYNLRYPAKYADKLFDSVCLENAVKMSGAVTLEMPSALMRYAFAEALVRKELRAGPLADLNQVSRLSHPSFDPSEYTGKEWKKVSTAKIETAKVVRQAEVALSHFGECVARADPSASYRLLMSGPASTQETAAFRSLAGPMSGCAEKGVKFKLARSMLRGAIANGYYRLAKAERGPIKAGSIK
jgi:hypothetical protein